MIDRSGGAQTAHHGQVVQVDLHCHSDASDGYYTAPIVADFLAEAGVAYAALTDHQTLAGLRTFHEAAARHHIAGVAGIEIPAMLEGVEIHLLAYGFDPESPALERLLGGTLDAAQAIAAIHEADGIAFLAHPLAVDGSPYTLDEAVERLARAGIDGIEAFYKPYPIETQERLAALADRMGLLTSGGSDYHGPNQISPGVAMPIARWKQFREALSDYARNGQHTPARPREAEPTPNPPNGQINWRWLFLHIMLPSLLVIGVFVTLIFGVLIPTMEQSLLERKREMAVELTNSAWSILWAYQQEVEAGELELEEAQQAAIERIRGLRYGPDDKDYFWITDMHPRMVMHPYRDDLEGSDLSDFTDPDGVRPFVAFVNAVRDDTSGFVRYVWQWQDDPDRLEPKESYVRRFAPWDWIIGTGLYVDDVRQEIDAITGRMVDISFIVTVLATGLLLTVAYQSLKVERERSAAEQDLRISHERYRALVESATSGTLLLLDGRCTYANRMLLDLLGYDAAELAFLDIHDIVLTEDQGTAAESLQRIVDGSKTHEHFEVREPFEARLRRKSGQTVPVLLSATAVFFSGQQGMILSVQDLTQHRTIQSAAERDRLISQLQTSTLFLTEPVGHIMEEPLSCPLDTPITRAVRLMSRHDTDAIVVTTKDGELVGMVSDRDLRERVMAVELDPQNPISQIMSAPLVTVSENAPLCEAFLLERERNVRHLAVTDGSGALVGIIQSSRALQPDRYSLVAFTYGIRRAQTIGALVEIYQRLPALIGSLAESGALAQNLCHVTTSVSDAIAERVIALTLEQIGPAPVPFAFIALGSEARQEQTLATDQDNALIYADPPPKATGVAEYFLTFGEQVCDALDRIGYQHCKGDTMAKNPRWNQPLRRWKQYVAEWIAEPDEQALAHCHIFLDHRHIYGDRSLVNAWWEHIAGIVTARRAFLSHMAMKALRYKPPMGRFGRIVTGADGEGPNTFNIKDAMLPIVNFARLYALEHRMEEVNTFSRLERLSSLGVLQEEDYQGIYQAYAHLMRLRYRHQVDMLKMGREPDNSIDPRTLTQIEIGILKNTFSRISMIQKKVSYDFRITG
jgi:PAS domain S-box-containing protein